MNTIEVPILEGTTVVSAPIPHPRLARRLGPGEWAKPGELLIWIPHPKEGDLRFAWNPLNIPEIHEAEEFFNQCIAEGLVPYYVGPDGDSAEPMSLFDAGAGEVLFITLEDVAKRGGSVAMHPKKLMVGG